MAYARTLARAEALIAAGVCLVDTAASVAATSDMVFMVVDDLRKIMVGNPDDVRVVVGCAMADRQQEGARREVHAELQTMVAVTNVTMVCGHVSSIGLLLRPSASTILGRLAAHEHNLMSCGPPISAGRSRRGAGTWRCG
ncbi:hypothetical protein VPH35_051455 [Triticum aestivum]|uniref:Uncharacterized protein n=1 Tax=Triticum aestivum TaxID=4565 RepID=A0A077RZG1_WHEAT|nr:unnamed protein product [Triticum aestivum]